MKAKLVKLDVCDGRTIALKIDANPSEFSASVKDGLPKKLTADYAKLERACEQTPQCVQIRKLADAIRQRGGALAELATARADLDAQFQTAVVGGDETAAIQGRADRLDSDIGRVRREIDVLRRELDQHRRAALADQPDVGELRQACRVEREAIEAELTTVVAALLARRQAVVGLERRLGNLGQRRQAAVDAAVREVETTAV